MVAKPKKVSLSGKTRLTYREAYALMNAAYAGIEDLIDGQTNRSLAIADVAQTAIDKLKFAMDKAGGLLQDGTWVDPFEKYTLDYYEGGES